MIFVTVGTTYFDELIEEVDRLKKTGEITEHVIAQIGRGQYEPEHCEHFRYTDEIGTYFDQADVVIGHGGTGTVFDVLERGRPLVAVANHRLQHDHQTEFLKAISRCGYCQCCFHLQDLSACLARARRQVARYVNPEPLSDAVWDIACMPTDRACHPSVRR